MGFQSARVWRAAPVAWLFAFSTAASAAVPVRIDFSRPDEPGRWEATHEVAGVRHSADGMEVHISGADPYVTGPTIEPPQDFPTDTSLLLELNLKCERDGFVEVFHFPEGGHATPTRSVSARVRAGGWQDVLLPLPLLERRVRLRLDPPGTGGKVTVRSLTLRARPRLPQWPGQRPPGVREGAPLVVRSGDLQVVHDGKSAGGFEVRVGGTPVAVGMTRSLVGYSIGGEARWGELPAEAQVRAEAGAVVESSQWTDADGATWRIVRRYAAAKVAGSVDVEARVTVDRDRDVLFLPAIVLLPGAGSFGGGKSQALFAGLEYLDRDEPSSSEADVTTPASNRRVPQSSKVTFPLMAVCAGGRYVGLVWDRAADFSPLFDSPDRTFAAGGHAMGLVVPGDAPRRQLDGDPLPVAPHRLAAGHAVVVRGTIVGGAGDTVLPAVRHFVALRGLPTSPIEDLPAADLHALMAGGWLDSKLREGNLVRHAVWPGFGAMPAADAAVWTRWLGTRVRRGDAPLAGRLREASDAFVGAVTPDRYDTSHVGHVTFPAVASLVFGHVEENARATEEHGRRLLRRFEPDGTLRYRAEAGKSDFARTHFARDANGFAAPVVVKVLEAATVSGDAELLREGLRLLRALDRYRGTVPRGAQSWEVPLHTPDVLAAAYLVRAYTLGYELTGDADLLAGAVDWAWAGVPFVYLDNPTGGEIGPYATIPVFGASHWIDVWFGRPVQWCGLVYADALYRLRAHDPAGPWSKLADGITASGVQQTWPASDRDRRGLLPDFFHLAPQQRDGPAINPATLQACATRLVADAPHVYGFHCFREQGVMVHVPGDVVAPSAEGGTLSFRVKGWPSDGYHVLVSGLRSRPEVEVDGRVRPPGEGCRFAEGDGRLVLRAAGEPVVRLRLRP